MSTVRLAGAIPVDAGRSDQGRMALPGAIMVFPAGRHAIRATRDGKEWVGTIEVTPVTALRMQEALEGHLQAQRRPFFDFAHKRDEASGWPKKFFWRDAPGPAGVYAQVDWSEAGYAAIAGRSYRSFSPSFFTDEASEVQQVVGAPLDMGGLINDPAFTAIAPIWAGRAGGGDSAKLISGAAVGPENPNQTRTTDTMNREAILALLSALGITPAAEATDEQLMELFAEATAKAAALSAEAEKLRASAEEAAVAAARAAVEGAVRAGRIPPKNTALQGQWVEALKADPSKVALLNAISPHPVAASAAASASGGAPGPVFAAASASAQPGLIEAAREYGAEKSPAARAAIYSTHIAGEVRKGVALGPILAENALGALSGDLVTQRALDLLYEQYPWIRLITTNFSDQGANFGQTIVTRTKGPITASDYAPGTGYVSQDANTPNVSIPLSKHKYAQVTFGVNEQSATSRDLFAEQAEVLASAIGDALAADIIAVITATAFTAGQTSPIASISKATANALAKVLTKAKVPRSGRILLLSPDAAESLSNDATVVALSTNSRVEVFAEYTLPRISGFQPFDTNAFPATATGALCGFACTSAALALATRLPNDYSGGDGAVSTIQNADGLAVQKVDWVDHAKGGRSVRLALMYGAAAGVGSAGVRLTVAAAS